VIWLVGAAFALALLFVLNYGFRSNWREKLAGRSAMLWAVIVAIVLGLAFAHRLFDGLPSWLPIAVWPLILLGLVVQNVTLARYQHRDYDRTEARRARRRVRERRDLLRRRRR
jgi:hypothetical protein